MGDLIDTSGAVTTIVNGSTGYLTEFMPLFAFVIGLALAIVVMTAILQMILSRNNEGQKFNARETWDDFLE
jgi:cytochrome c biogenesis protein CcdA